MPNFSAGSDVILRTASSRVSVFFSRTYRPSTLGKLPETLGWGFPASLGARCAAPDRPVVCFTGDGGFWYHVGELETAARWNIATVVVVNNNRSLNQVKRGAERIYGGQPGKSDQIWQFTDVDFARVAESMGCVGIRVTKPGDLQGALEKALRSRRPAVVDCVSDILGIAPPPWSP